VYKQIGPAMIKQDLVEAQTNVSKRLEFIQVRLSPKLQTLPCCETQQQHASGSTCCSCKPSSVS
jgi:chaperonin cofactor prefoldin